ncbi:Glutamate 5-kinase [Planctomycetes bacterium CA13]|uniref:Glutamate 5-kinase n=1 Tax=Novipirellula herctigrandis TaxID=2527986 RepID=A0A5C5Z5U5_9BACT|nr:Glutamate 5-kinase [Planctomycetes bacterium CA13]
MAESDTSLIQHRKAAIDRSRCVVVKVGTSVLTAPDGSLDQHRINSLSAQLCRIADSGRQVVMVSSGAVGAGVGKLGLISRPSGLAQLQACAAIGQASLIQAYELGLSAGGRHAAQVLLTAMDLRRRSGYLHVRNALTQLHEFGAIAVINENDSVAVAELMTTFGDNDRLAAHVAGLMNDTLMIILSDVDGLYDGPPNLPTSERIHVVETLDESILALAEDHTGSMSTGGMASKLEAVTIATSHGHTAIIGPGHDDTVLDKIFAGEPIGTLFLPHERSIKGRRRWIGGTAPVAGTLHLDEGASKAVFQKGGSLLAVGITDVTGTFKRGSVVSLVDPSGHEIARGLCNYPSSEVSRILGQSSDYIEEILGTRPYENVVHRNNLVLNRNNDSDLF